MPVIYRDIETRSTLNLTKVGPWRYAGDATTGVWCTAYAVDDGPAQIWTPDQPIPEEFHIAARDPEWLLAAHNDAFESAIEERVLAPRYGWPIIPRERHRCTMAMALAHALPGGLDKAAAALGLELRKDDAGRRLMLQMARPRKPRADEDPNGIYWYDDPERIHRLQEYCAHDVEVERALFHRLPPLSDAEQALWALDQQINRRGFPVDVALAEAAHIIARERRVAIDAEISELTGGKITTANQVAKIEAFLKERGHNVQSVGKRSVAAVLAHKPDADVAQLLRLRQEAAKASANKLAALLNLANDNRLHDTLRFHGAATGRWSGSRFQPQNLARATPANPEAAIAAVSSGELARVAGIGPPLAVIGSLSRAMICAPPGRVLIGADYSGIEARVTAWLAGEQWLLDAYRDFDTAGGLDPYCQTAAKILGRPVTPEQDADRQIGKMCTLAFGFGGGAGAFRRIAPDADFTDAQVENFKRQWRAAHPRIVKFWAELHRALLRAVRSSKPVTFKNLTAQMRDGNLYLQLPSGRELVYPEARLQPGQFDSDEIVFKDSAIGKWQDTRAWHGTFTENVVQAIARDLLAAAMPRLEAAGYPIVLHVHDEIVAEVADDFGSPEEFAALMTEAPTWAKGLSIVAKAWRQQRYGKEGKPSAIAIVEAETVADGAEPESPAPMAEEDTDEQLLQALKALAHSTRIIATMGYVQIDSGGEDQKPRPFSDTRKSRIRKLWPLLSSEDQETLSKREGFEFIWPVTQEDLDEINEGLKREGIETIESTATAPNDATITVASPAAAAAIADMLASTPRGTTTEPNAYDVEDGNGAADNADDSGSDHHEQTNGAAGAPPTDPELGPYIYQNAHGGPHAKVVRTPSGRSRFTQQHWTGAAWHSGMPKHKLPYRLPELLAADPADWVCITEGEKDCVNVAKLGFVATTNPNGANGWNSAKLVPYFAHLRRIAILEDNDAAGCERTKRIIKTLRILDPVPDIRVLTFPELPSGGDVSDWLAQDQSRGQTELLARIEAATAGAVGLGVWDAGDDALLDNPPPRAWLLGNSFARRFLSALIAEGGTGKTALRYAQYLSLVTGRELTGERVFQRCRVLIVSLEDNADELRRRIRAVMLHHGIERAELRGWLFLSTPSARAGKLMTISDRGHPEPGLMAAALEKDIDEFRPDLVGLDPFVKTHSVSENDNAAIDDVVQILADLATKYDIGVDTPHHARKGPAIPGDADRGRGAGAMRDAFRLNRTLTAMSADEAEAFGIPEEQRKLYLRVDNAKVNIAPPMLKAQWFHIIGVQLGNATELYPSGDNVQTVEPWIPPEIWQDLDADRILDAIDAGLPDGNRYSAVSKAGEREAWRAVVEHAPNKTEAQAREIIRTWVKTGVLAVKQYQNPKTTKFVNGLFVVAAKRPTQPD